MAQGRALEKAGKLPEARAAYRQAQEICPSCGTAP
jgi:Flp pilus assembly protein TadD